MLHRAFLYVPTVLILLFSFIARAQEPVPERTPNEGAAEVRKKAIKLLESVGSEVATLHSAETRARIGSNVIDLLWDHDEKRSRAQLATVAEDIRAGYIDALADDPERGRGLVVFGPVRSEVQDQIAYDPERSYRLRVFAKLRSDIIDRMAKHDLDVALGFLRGTRPPQEGQSEEMKNSEILLELHLAKEVTAKDPQFALRLARESLAKGFNPDLLPLLTRLHRQDKQAGQSLFESIVDKLRQVNLTDDPGALGFALRLTRAFQPPRADEQVYRDLIGLISKAALDSGCAKADPDSDDAPPVCYEIAQVLPQIEKYYSSRAAALKRWADEESGGMSDRYQMWDELQEVGDTGTVDEILSLATTYPEMRGRLAWTALMRTLGSGDLARARQIAAEVPDSVERGRMLEIIESSQKWKLLTAERLATVHQQLSQIRGSEQRATFLLYTATEVGAADRAAALGLLDEASQTIDTIKPGRIQLEGRIRLAMQYCQLKSDRGFTIMESVLPRLNELVAAAATLDGYENSYFRDGEWNMTGEGVVGRLLTALAQNAGYFAALDFDRSVGLANQLDRPELRLMAQQKIAQGVLNPSAPPNFGFPITLNRY